MSRAHRSAFAKFRLGVAPLRIETGRYEGLIENERICPFYKNHTEDELHVLFDCFLYNDIRSDVFRNAQFLNTNFNKLVRTEKFKFLFNSPNLIRPCSETCFLILQILSVELLVFFCSSVPVLSQHVSVESSSFFIIVFICDLFVSRDDPLVN